MKKYVLIMILVFAVMMQGCAGKGDSGAVVSDADTANEEKMEDVAETTTEDVKTEETVVEPTAVPTEAPVLVLPLTTNDSGKVTIQTVTQSLPYPYNSYLITSINGEIAVVDPTAMPKKEMADINPVAIACTHAHPDHVDNAFTKSYDCQKLLFEVAKLTTEDFKIHSIASSHYSDDILTNSNVFIVFEVDGLRIVHMGDCGQTVLTEEQLADLGEIDIAFTQFENSYSAMTLENEKGFNLIEQLNPKIIIPTHYTDAGLAELETRYGAVTEFENIMEISKEDLPEDTMNVYRILNTHNYR